ncbi:coiled-coil domain-containing protein 138-like isoform X3 [Apostichopus japonicus]
MTVSSPSALNSQERKHYNRALRELCHIIKLDSRQLEISQLMDGDDYLDGVENVSNAAFTPQSQKKTPRRRRNGTHGSYQLDDVEASSDELFGSRQSSSTQQSGTPSRGSQQHSNLPENINMVYEELAAISDKLKREHAALLDHEVIVNEKLQLLQAEEEKKSRDLDKSIRDLEEDCQRRLKEMEKEQHTKLKEIHQVMTEKAKENKRLKESFDTLKNVNDSLRKQLDEICTKNKKLETQAISVQHRLTNLQRKQDVSDRQRAADKFTDQLRAQAQGNKIAKSGKQGFNQHSKPDHAVFDILGILLEWISDVHLKEIQPGDYPESLDMTKERCLKILPLLVDTLHNLPTSSSKLHLPCLQFILWALSYSLQQEQAVSLVSTLRRLGEELYRTPSALRLRAHSETEGKTKVSLFFKSPSLHIRFLSSLIILRTLSQVDLLANVFDVLRADLKDERSKELFLEYRATDIILPFLKSSNIAILAGAVDVFLQMSMESVYLLKFLESCCNEGWFQACSLLLKSTSLDLKILEKISILLQKLSKLKNTRKLFETSGLSLLIQEMSRAGPCQENAFLSLNLKSILFNLNITKTSSS